MPKVIQKGVRTLHRDYDNYSFKWKRCRDVMAGQDAVHTGKKAYLPRLKEQSDEDYNAYVMRAVFYNASWRTVSGLNGMMFRKPPKQTIPKAIEPLLDDITMSGVPFGQFAKDVAIDVLEVGRIGLLVDHPAMPLNADGQVTTLAMAQATNLRPTIQSYAAEAIINWKFRNIRNQNCLCMVVLKEEYSEPDGEFGEKCEPRYRVLDLLPGTNVYRIRVFRINAKQEDEQVGPDVFPMMNGKALDFIPFVFIGPDGTEAKLEEPPLIDLVDLNLSHYRTTADYEHGCHFTGLPTPWIAGASATLDASGQAIKYYIGSQAAWVFVDPKAKVGFLEFTGQGLQTLRDNLDAKKQEMATLGARMLADTSMRQVETFGATAIKHVAENSILAAIAISVSEGLEQALVWFAKWAGNEEDIVFEINQDFMPVQMDAPTLTAIMTMWQGGALSEAEMFDLLKRGDIVEADKTLEEHQAEVDAAPPPAPPSTVRPGALGTPTPDQQLAHDVKTAKAMPKPPMKKAA